VSTFSTLMCVHGRPKKCGEAILFASLSLENNVKNTLKTDYLQFWANRELVHDHLSIHQSEQTVEVFVDNADDNILSFTISALRISWHICFGL